MGIPLPFDAGVMRARSPRRRTKLSLYAETVRFPFVSHTHSVRPPLYFNNTIFLQVTVLGMCNFVQCYCFRATEGLKTQE